MLDLTDKKILYYLDQNSRHSISQIAKKCRIHRNVALYRIKKLEKRGIIKGYFTELNLRALGYNIFRVLIKFENYDDEQFKKVINHLKKNKHLIWLFEVQGKWDLDFVHVCKGTWNFYEYYNKFKEQFNSIIAEDKISIMMQIHHYTKDYLIDKKRIQPKRKKFIEKKEEPDKKDFKILRELSEKSNISLLELHEKTKISINTLKSRIKKLKKNNTILGFRPFIDTAKTGYKFFKINLNLKNYTKNDLRKIQTYVETDNRLVYITTYINGDDMELEMHFKDEEELKILKEKLRSEYGKIINEINVFEFTKEHIYRYLPKNES